MKMMTVVLLAMMTCVFTLGNAILPGDTIPYKGQQKPRTAEQQKQHKKK